MFSGVVMGRAIHHRFIERKSSSVTRRDKAVVKGGTMALIVQKYGGTSVGDLERIKKVAQRAIAAQRQGHRVVVVVSAMSGETNRLLKLVEGLSARPNEREQDVVVATGEQVTIGLLAIAVGALKGNARSFMGHQCRIVTDSTFSKARIKRIDADGLFAALDKGEIAIVAGFQGVDDEGNITTLGRGGSDTTAVAIAAALNADACEIYTDVDGVYTTDPNVCPTARKLERISYEEMMELASLGAKVLQIRSVEIAMKYRVPLWVKSSFVDDPGTLVCEEDKAMEDILVSGVALDRNEARVSVRGVPDRPGMAAKIFGALDERAISVDLIVQNSPTDGKTDLTFTVAKADVVKTQDVMKKVLKALKAGPVEIDDQVSKVSIVGVGMRTHSGVAARMFKTLSEEGVNILAISTSEIRVSCLIQSKYAELAVRALHAQFELDQP
jgi:aspartate kinase